MPLNLRQMAVLSLALPTCALMIPLFTSAIVFLVPEVMRSSRSFWTIFMWVGPLLGLFSVILAHVVMNQTTQEPALPARSIARSGLILGYIILARAALGFVVAFNYSQAMKDFH